MAKIINPLTDTQPRNAKPKAKPYKHHHVKSGSAGKQAG